jgi:DNA primase
VLPLDRWPEPQAWGVRGELKDNGKIKKLWFPKGHVLPITEGDRVLQVKFRRPMSAGDPRYIFLRGSIPTAKVVSPNPRSDVFVIVENLLDGLLLGQEGSALGAGVIATGSASVRPDSLAPEVQDALKNSSCILVSLDFDKAKDAEDKGAWAGGKGALAWLRQFPQAFRWPVAAGKDITEMWQAGKNLKTWLEVGIERGTKLKGENQ